MIQMKSESLIGYNGDQLLSIPEVAELIGTNPNYVRGLVDAGLLPAIGFGRIRRVRKFTLNECLAKYDGEDLPKPKGGPKNDRYRKNY